MAANGDFVTAVIAGGGGAALGSVITAAVQAWSKKGANRGQAADLVAEAAGRAAQVSAELLERYREENIHLRESLVLLTDVLDELFAAGEIHASADAVKKLKAARRAIMIQAV